MLPGGNHSRTIARTPHLDWICVDCEHGNISDADMHDCVAAIAACGVSPVVRVADGQHWMIKRALDAGAHGIIIPLLATAEDAKKVVSFCKFPPEGTRGLGSPFSTEKFIGQAVNPPKISLAQYHREANSSIVVIVQIETTSALHEIGEIAATSGVDACLVGPMDLGNSIGHPVDENGQYDQVLEDAIAKIHQATQAAGKYSVMYTANGTRAREYAERGYNMVSAMNDVDAISKKFEEALAIATGSSGDSGRLGT